ncbi:MAG TPA: ADOP family duplicated permease [Acidobacteriota bacterium]|nr:ADOP family duplicated permease [Acidobacteriota bacterium]
MDDRTPAEQHYRQLLRVLPKAFRREAEEALLETFRAEYAACLHGNAACSPEGGEAVSQGRQHSRQQSGSSAGNSSPVDASGHGSAESAGAMAQWARRCCLVLLWTRLIFDLLLTAVAVRMQALRGHLRLASSSTRTPFKGSTLMSRFVQDLKYAFRALRRTPGFMVVALLTLALGIGANASVFSVVHALLFQDPPYLTEPERLVRMVRTREGRLLGAFSYPDFAYYRDHNDVFESMTGYDPSGLALTVRMGGETFAARGLLVSQEYFEVLGVRPQAGRWFRPDEGRTPSTHPVAVISHGLFQRLLGGRPDSLPASLTLNGHTFTAVGAAPPGFSGASPLEPPPDLWVPLMMQPVLAPAGGEWTLRRVPGHSWNWLSVLARLKPGISRQAAQSNLDAMAAHLAENFAEWNESTGAHVLDSYRFIPQARDSILSMSRLLTTAVGLLLLIACVNVAVLLLARATARRHDVGIRMALGAGRWRVLRLSLMESLLLALGGGLLGVLLAYWTSGLTRALLPFDIPSFAGPGLAVMTASLALAAATALLAALIPALRTSRLDAFSALRAQQGLDGGGRLRRGLVIAQVALSLVLVCSAVLLARSLYAARAVDLGFQAENRLLLRLNLRFHGYDEERGQTFISQALERLREHPAVLGAAASHMVPFRGMWTRDILPDVGYAQAQEDTPSQDASRRDLDQSRRNRVTERVISPGTNAVSPGYFESMGIPVRGRVFSHRDTAQSPPVVIVNEAFARTIWPDGDALGRGIYFESDQPPATVIGVARNARYYSLQGEPQQQVYWPLSQQYMPRFDFIIHTRLLNSETVQALRTSLLQVDPSLALQDVRTLQEVVDSESAQYRTSAAAVTLFAVLALALAAVGLYGVESYLVSQRRREIGVRMALGAGRRQIQSAVLFSAARQTLWGLLLGLPAAILAAQWLRSHLFGTPAHDLITWLGVPLVLLAVALAAAAFPALRASRIDPLLTLRAD